MYFIWALMWELHISGMKRLHGKTTLFEQASQVHHANGVYEFTNRGVSGLSVLSKKTCLPESHKSCRMNLYTIEILQLTL